MSSSGALIRWLKAKQEGTGSTQESETGRSLEFETSLVYSASAKAARATQTKNSSNNNNNKKDYLNGV